MKTNKIYKSLILWIVLLFKSNIYASEIPDIEDICLSIIPVQGTKTISKEEVYQNTLPSSFKVQQRDSKLSPFPSYQKRIMVVTGISCTGKSSICKALAKLDPHILLLEYDTFLKESIYNFITSFKKQDTLGGDLLEGIIDTITLAEGNPLKVSALKKLTPYLNASPTPEKLDYDLSPNWEEIDKNTLIHLKERASFFLHIGKTVVIDLAAIKEDLDHFNDLRPIYCLIYCPLAKLAEHIEKRNLRAIQDNKPADWRPAMGILEQFSSFFRTRKTNNIFQKVDILKRSKLIRICEKLSRWPYTFPTLGAEELTGFQNDILTKLLFQNGKKHNLYTTYTFSYVLNNSSLTPEEGANNIYHFLFMKNVTNK